MDRFWPGPLTIVLDLKAGHPLSTLVTAGLGTVGIRMPAHSVARAIIAEAGCPVAAPSANMSGSPSPTTAAHVLGDMEGRIVGIVDAGSSSVGVESTVVSVGGPNGTVPTILRPGGVTIAMLTEATGSEWVEASSVAENAAPSAPGMKYTHYAPKAPVTIIEGSDAFIQQCVDRVSRAVAVPHLLLPHFLLTQKSSCTCPLRVCIIPHLSTQHRGEGKKVGLLTTTDKEAGFSADVIICSGNSTDLDTVARGLFGALRDFDAAEVDLILSESFQSDGIGIAVMNRLTKAAGFKVTREVDSL
jgi:L-threonylcarbamoyladenylate synthase